jgi:outer membrane protein OmpA-like peptidoglycan-associated protein
MRFQFPQGFYGSLAADFGLSDDKMRTTINRNGYTYTAKGLPAYGFQVTLGWNGILKHADNDNDGFSNIDDKCMDLAEDKDGFQDDDGCPDPDNDGDGIADAQDSCPNEKATSNGCPVFDADGDGILDDKDKCPQKYEDFDAFEDGDGCPELDNDADGIPDNIDRCPNAAEDKDGYEDTDGCPDLDNDADGVPDSLDKCPTARGALADSGCPATPEIRESLVLDGVTFLTGKAKLDPNSYTILDKAVQSLRDWPDVKIEIRGYTDSQGGAEVNLRLSQKRSEAVMFYFISKGISPARLSAIGRGMADPVGDNTTAEGRARNRRVELHRVK